MRVPKLVLDFDWTQFLSWILLSSLAASILLFDMGEAILSSSEMVWGFTAWVSYIVEV